MNVTNAVRAQRSVFGTFALCGLAISSLLSRIPQLRDTLHLRPGPLGLLLLMTAVGSLVSLPLAGLVVQRFGTARTVAVSTGVNAAGLAVAGVGTRVGPVLVGAGLFLFGFGAGQWDVAQNVEGAAVEQRLGRSVMSRFHAVFSLGTIGGALVGAAMNALGVAVLPHLLVVAVVLTGGGAVTARGFLPWAPIDPAAAGTDRSGTIGQTWTEPRTLLIGLFVLCTAFAEGTGNDWLGVATIDGYGASATVGSFAYVTLVTAMTVGRWFGPRVLDRHGRVPVLRAGSVCALAGVLVVVLGPSLVTAFAGMVLWGLGAALGFPTGMSAAADDPARAAARVSVVSTIGYSAFLAGPSLIGVIGDHTGVRNALTLNAVLLAVATALAVATREPTPAVPAEADVPATA